MCLFNFKVQNETLAKIIALCAMIFLTGSFCLNLFSIFGPYIEMRKGIKEISKNLDAAEDSITVSRTKLDSLSKLLVECNNYITDVQNKINMVDARQRLESDNFRTMDAKLRKKLQVIIDSLDRENLDSVVSNIVIH